MTNIHLFYLSLDASLPPGMFPWGVAMAEKPPPLPVQTLPPCLFKPSFPMYILAPISHTSSFTLSFYCPLQLGPSVSLTHTLITHVLLQPIPPSSKWPSYPTKTLYFTHIGYTSSTYIPTPSPYLFISQVTFCSCCCC